jgi:hypothetical protein
LTVACGEKKDPASSADAAQDAPAQASESEPSSDLPQDKTSKNFAKALVATQITKFSPTDDRLLKYDTMSFEADASWSSQAVVEIMDERLECVESGGWSMEPANSDTKATLTWTVDGTNCAGREAGDVQRAVVDLEGGGFNLSFR